MVRDNEELAASLEDAYPLEEADKLIEEADIEYRQLLVLLIEQGLINDQNIPWLFDGGEGEEIEEEEEEPDC